MQHALAVAQLLADRELGLGALGRAVQHIDAEQLVEG
jgi:hypothetical protein